MSDLRADIHEVLDRSPLWVRLREERFTNIDLVLVLGALVFTGLVGALSGVVLFG